MLGVTPLILLWTTHFSALNEEQRNYVFNAVGGPGANHSSIAPASTGKWSMGELLRLALCMLECCEVAGGISFLQFFREERTRANLNLSMQHVEAALATIFNDPTRRWNHPTVLALQRFNVHELVIPRRGDELRQKLSVLMQDVNSWHENFTRSGQHGIAFWDWTPNPIAELFFKIEPGAIQTLTTSIVGTDGLPLAGVPTEVNADVLPRLHFTQCIEMLFVCLAWCGPGRRKRA